MQFSEEKKELARKICRELDMVEPQLEDCLIGEGYAGSIWKISDSLCLKVSTKTCYTEFPEVFKKCENLCVPLKSYLSSSGRYVGFVQRYLNLHSVQYLIKNKRKLSEKQAAEIIYDILKGLKVMHENNYVHRDFYPGNIMLTRNKGRVSAVIIDFDEMQLIGTKTKACFRYSGYQAPEIVFYNDNYDDKSEMFAVGVILWELVIGECSFGGYELFGRVVEHSWDEYSKNSEFYNNRVKCALMTLSHSLKKAEGISEECMNLLCLLLSFDRSSRITAVDALDHLFFKGIN